MHQFDWLLSFREEARVAGHDALFLQQLAQATCLLADQIVVGYRSSATRAPGMVEPACVFAACSKGRVSHPGRVGPRGGWWLPTADVFARSVRPGHAGGTSPRSRRSAWSCSTLSSKSCANLATLGSFVQNQHAVGRQIVDQRRGAQEATIELEAPKAWLPRGAFSGRARRRPRTVAALYQGHADRQRPGQDLVGRSDRGHLELLGGALSGGSNRRMVSTSSPTARSALAARPVERRPGCRLGD